MPMPKKPAALARLEGNPGRRPIPQEIDGRGHPEPPPGLNTEEGELWLAIYESLPLGLLTAADSVTMERMAIAWARFRWCQRAIRQSSVVIIARDRLGKERPIKNPLVTVQKMASEEIQQCTAELGLSPLARTRITAEGKEEDDPLALLLDGRRDGAYYRPATRQIEG